MPPLRDLMGQRFGRLTVIDRSNRRGDSAFWVCRCDCGETLHVLSRSLTQCNTQSCGCLCREINTNRLLAMNTNHGHARDGKMTPEYTSWMAMRARCYRRTAVQFSHYGGRGITVCPEWRQNFEAFFRDMGPRPSFKYSLDRIDNDGPYAPWNCRWQEQTAQCNNRRSNRHVLVNGERRTLAEASRACGVPYSTLRNRLCHSKRTELGGVLIEVA